MDKSWQYSAWCCFWQLLALFVLGFLENAFIQQGIFMIQVVFISRDPPIRENLFCPQIKYVSNTITSAQHSPTILPLFIKDIDPDQMFLPPGNTLTSLHLTLVSQPCNEKWASSGKNYIMFMKSITIEYKCILTFRKWKYVYMHKSKFGRIYTQKLTRISG